MVHLLDKRLFWYRYIIDDSTLVTLSLLGFLLTTGSVLVLFFSFACLQEGNLAVGKAYAWLDHSLLSNERLNASADGFLFRGKLEEGMQLASSYVDLLETQVNTTAWAPVVTRLKYALRDEGTVHVHEG